MLNRDEWLIATTYGNKEVYKRRQLWEDLQTFTNSCIPCIFGGDFNCILSQEEKRGGKRFVFSQGPQDMQIFMKRCDFHDIGTIGRKFTWCNNKKGGARILERMDRCLLNSAALTIIQPNALHLLGRNALDHCPIDINICSSGFKKNRRLQFEEVWTSYPASKGIVVNLWKKPTGVASARRNSNHVRQIRSSDGTLTEEQRCIEEIFSNHFQEKWKFRRCSHTSWPNISRSLDEVDKEQLMANLSEEELEKVISHLESNISPGIDAFIKGRSISEDILLTQEIFHKFRNSKAKKGLMSIKVYMEHTYDSMGWNTLKNVLDLFGFPSFFVNLLIQCVVDTKYSINVNGRNTNWIRAECGFRQQCPLSPYLFIMCSQLLTKVFNRDGAKIGVKVASNAENFSHLQYADDTIIFVEVNRRNAIKIKKILKKYSGWTGQKDVLEKAFDKLNVWGNHSLTLAGKLQLIKSALLSILIFISTHSLVRMGVLRELDKLGRNFLWSKLVHGSVEDSISAITTNAISFASSSFSQDIISANWVSNQHSLFQDTWKPPPTEWIKLNVDASLDNNYSVGIGGVIRDYKGRFLFAFGFKSIHWVISALELDALMALNKITQEWMYEAKGIIIEGDNYNIMKHIQEIFKKGPTVSNHP
ncbi:uncharacterized protein LOC114581242 [Dendrobium catenatum]|uniref:uncharacterized protein LOC114581242 n=1 Tax=Dendrobium catenatum TaxID=906689 RepID=UPI0010A09E7E|nr:uncharacterized protein LOC114581242 [Dendrobium catenatum]